MAVTIPVTGGVIQAVEGETYILSPNTTGNITFRGDAAFTVEINDDQTFTTADNARIIRFDAGTDPTVNIAAGVDSTTHQIDANGDTLTLNVGDGATFGIANADSVSDPAGFVMTAGENVSNVGGVTGPDAVGAASDITIGNNFSTNGNLNGSVRGDTTMTIGDGLNVGGRLGIQTTGEVDMTVGSNATVGNSVDLRGFSATSGSKVATFGDNLNVTGNMDVRLSTDNVLTIGDNASISAITNFDGASTATVNIGDNFTQGVNFVTSNGADNVTIGNNWEIGGSMDLIGGNDQLSMGFQNDVTGGVTTVISGGVGVDGITVAAPPGLEADFETAAVAAGWSYDPATNTASAPPTGANAFNPFTFGGVQYRFFEGPGNPICFTAGTQITVANGATVAVEDLRQGDMVMTADHGLQEIKWTGTNTLAGAALEDNVRPIRIAAGALGGGLPLQDLLVSPQHRMLVCSSIAQKMFGEDEVLVAAKHLVLIDGIDVVADAEEVTYVHFLCDQHEVVFANGAASESLFTGPQALKSVSGAAVVEIMSLFPELADVDYKAISARKLSNGRMGRQLAVRHKNNNRPLLPTRH